MVEAIKKELVLRRDYLPDKNLKTIYFGGGTPSVLEPRKLEEILKLIKSEFNLMQGAEVTLEANPDDLSPENCDAYLRMGINRLSIGIQSFHNDDLLFMNRAHTAEQAVSSVKNARQAGFENLSIDLIYGIQNQSPGQWKENLVTAFSLDVDHLSCYALTVEHRTALADMIRKGKVKDVDEEKILEDFDLLMSYAEEEGYEHYEISNFARNKKYSVHNTSYWMGEHYLGIGPSAHSFDGSSRQWNISNNQLYIRDIANGKVPFEREVLSRKNRINEFILTALRTKWGLDPALMSDRFGEETAFKLKSEIENFIEINLVQMHAGKFVLSRKGKFFADKIASELFS
jgi:oxygen-independent coproporphyrinogen-3 oxidase